MPLFVCTHFLIHVSKKNVNFTSLKFNSLCHKSRENVNTWRKPRKLMENTPVWLVEFMVALPSVNTASFFNASSLTHISLKEKQMSAIFTDLPDLDFSLEKNHRSLQDVLVSEIPVPSLTELMPPLEPAEPKPQPNNNSLAIVVHENPIAALTDVTVSQAKTRGWVDITPFLTVPQVRHHKLSNLTKPERSSS